MDEEASRSKDDNAQAVSDPSDNDDSCDGGGDAHIATPKSSIWRFENWCASSQAAAIQHLMCDARNVLISSGMGTLTQDRRIVFENRSDRDCGDPLEHDEAEDQNKVSEFVPVLNGSYTVGDLIREFLTIRSCEHMPFSAAKVELRRGHQHGARTLRIRLKFRESE
jgi:hypothetical protein